MKPQEVARFMAGILESHLAGRPPALIPDWCGPLWRWFADLSESRSFHAAGPNPISHAEIAAYAKTRRAPMSGDHVEIIKALDRTFLDFMRRRTEAGGAPTKGAVSKTALTADLFDAMMG